MSNPPCFALSDAAFSSMNAGRITACDVFVRDKLTARNANITKLAVSELSAGNGNGNLTIEGNLTMNGDICGDGTNTLKDFDNIITNNLTVENNLTIKGDICGDGTNTLKDFETVSVIPGGAIETNCIRGTDTDTELNIKNNTVFQKSVVIDVNLTVKGTTTTTTEEQLHIGDHTILLNNCYRDPTPIMGGIVVNRRSLINSFVDSISIPATLVSSTDISASLMAGDIIMVCDSINPQNNGLFEVASVSTFTITIEMAPNIDFVQNAFDGNETSPPSTVTVSKIEVSVLQSNIAGDNTAGDFQVTKGSNQVEINNPPGDTPPTGNLNPILVPTGAVFWFAGGAVPVGYLLCDSTAVSRIGFSALFDLIGILYGSGNGTTTFNVPDLISAGRFIRAAAVPGATQDDTIQTHDHTVTDGAGGLGHTHTQDAHLHSITDVEHQHAGGVGDGGIIPFNAPDPDPHSIELTSPAFSGITGTNNATAVNQLALTGLIVNPAVSTMGTFGGETRPINIGLMPCIKY